MKRWPRERKKEIWTTAADVKKFDGICFDTKVPAGKLLHLLLDLYDKDIKPYKPEQSFA